MIKELEMFSLKKRKNEEGARLFLVVLSDRTRGSRHRLKPAKFHLNIRKEFVTVEVAKHRHRLPRETAEFPSLEIFRP